jgi:hypothetical protein
MVKICKNDFEAYINSKSDYLKSLVAARAAIRKELGINDAVPVQQKDFSAVPSSGPQSVSEK